MPVFIDDWEGAHKDKNISPYKCPNRIRVLRFERGWSSGDLAKKIGVIRATVLDYERGRLHPGSNVLKRFCEAFDVEIGDLFWRKGEREQLQTTEISADDSDSE